MIQFLFGQIARIFTRLHVYAQHVLVGDSFSMKKKLLVAGLGKTLATADGVPDVLASLDISELKTLLDEAKQLVSDGVVQYCRMTFAKDRPRISDQPELAIAATSSEQCGPGCDC